MGSISKQLESIMQKVDADRDGSITVRETRDFFAQSSRIREQMWRHPEEHHDLFMSFKAEDTVAYHDMNGDMVASRQEVWDSLVQWNVIRTKMRYGLKNFLNLADREGLERFEKSLDYMRREPAVLPKRLRPELEALF